MTKDLLRQNYLVIRKNILNKKEKDAIITNRLIKLILSKKVHVVAIYYSLNNEVDTKSLIMKLVELGIKILLPRVVENDLLFFKYYPNMDLEKSSFGVDEPVYDLQNIHNDLIDMIIVPGICFDKKRNRIGYGKGYYDRFLINKNIYKVGICYDELIIDSIPYDDYDVKMDLIISNKRMY